MVNLRTTAATNLPNLSNLRRNIRRQQQEQNVLANPPKKEDVPVLPHEYQMTGTGKRFLFFDTGVGDVNRMFIFATNDGIDMLANSSQRFGNGTFKLCPQIFSQIYSIHALVNHDVLPCDFAFLPSKAEIVYEQFFTMVCNAVRNNNGNDPDGSLVDFETAAINAIRNVLPETDVSGCFFHLSSNLWKYIQRAGLQELFMNNPEFGLQLRMIAALAFVLHRIWLIPLINFVLLFEISMMEMLMNWSTISTMLTLVAFVGMPHHTLLYLLSSYGTCSIEPLKSFHEQIIISRLGIIVTKQMFHPLIQRSRSF